MKTCGLIFIMIFMQTITQKVVAQSADMNWKAGMAKVKITPESPMWMAGYGSRTSPSEGTLHDIWAKALMLEDSKGYRSVWVTLDLLGLPKAVSDEVRDQLKTKLNLDRSQIILNSSHTHSGPVLGNALVDIYPISKADEAKIDEYTEHLTQLLVNMVVEASKEMEKVHLYAENGVARFQVNRRNNVESLLTQQTSLAGPIDHAVPVIKVERMDGSIKGIVFGYACHATVLSMNKWSGDYPGFAQIELENAHPGAMAMFFQGAGADQNPLPRRTVALARQYGRTLAAAVDAVLEEDMQALEPRLSTAYQEIDLNLNQPPSQADLEAYCAAARGYQLKWGQRMLEKAKSGENFMETYPYPIQVWKLGDWPLFTLGGELVVGYANQLKKIFGQHSFVLGYTNDVMAYIPTAVILEEGGYEGASSQVVYGLPSIWSFNIESNIIRSMVELAATIDVEPKAKALIKK